MLYVYFIKNIYSLVGVGVCFTLCLLVGLRLVFGTYTYNKRIQYMLFLLATVSLGLASLFPIIRGMSHEYSHYLLWVTIFMAFSLNTYFLSLAKSCKQLAVISFIMVVLLSISFFNFAYSFHSFQNNQYPFSINILVIYTYTAYSLRKHLKMEKDPVYFIMISFFILMTIVTLYDTVSYLTHLLPVIFLSVWVAPLLSLSMGYYLLDRVFLQSRRDLQDELHRVKEEYAAQAENVEDVVIFLARTVDAKDKYTEGHIERVSQYAIFLGERIGMNSHRLDVLRIGALIHDIGKIGVDLNILNKPGRLTEAEFDLMKMHCNMGEQICIPLKALQEVSQIIRSHHEKLDGSGYPDGLKGEEIPLEARIVSIADIFDALTTDRPYREAMEVNKAINILNDEARQGKLDPFLVKEFIAMLIEMEYLF